MKSWNGSTQRKASAKEDSKLILAEAPNLGLGSLYRSSSRDRRLPMRLRALLLLALCGLAIVGVTQSKRAPAEETAMTAGDLQQICIGSSAESKAACRFYVLGITQGISMGMSIADGKTQGGRPCVPDDLSASAIELAVKMKLGEDLMVYPDDRKLDASGVVGAILVSTFP